jgi:hypothetical protein
LAIRTIEAANQRDRTILRLVAEGSSRNLDAFCVELDRGSVIIDSEDWVYSLGAFYDVEILSLRLL